MREQRLIRVIDLAAVEGDGAGAWIFQPCDKPQQRRLAAAGRPDQREAMHVVAGEIDAVEHGVRAELFHEAGQLKFHNESGAPASATKARSAR